MQREKTGEASLIAAIIQGMQAKKAQDISLLNLKHIDGAVAEYFIICSGRAKSQVEAIAEAIVETSYQHAGQRPWKQEGWAAKEWILVDYVNVVVHIFHADKRPFYALDTLWGDASTVYIEDDYGTSPSAFPTPCSAKS
ncbi:MAG: ribosome silencing factor [Roseivirga sp.]